MSYIREITGIRYAIEIPIDDFHALSDSESYRTNHAALDQENGTLDEKLGKQTKAMDVEYNGHFGNYIYLMLSAEDDTPETWVEIDRVISDHIAWCNTL